MRHDPNNVLNKRITKPSSGVLQTIYRRTYIKQFFSRGYHNSITRPWNTSGELQHKINTTGGLIYLHSKTGHRPDYGYKSKANVVKENTCTHKVSISIRSIRVSEQDVIWGSQKLCRHSVSLCIITFHRAWRNTGLNVHVTRNQSYEDSVLLDNNSHIFKKLDQTLLN